MLPKGKDVFFHSHHGLKSHRKVFRILTITRSIPEKAPTGEVKQGVRAARMTHSRSVLSPVIALLFINPHDAQPLPSQDRAF